MPNSPICARCGCEIAAGTGWTSGPPAHRFEPQCVSALLAKVRAQDLCNVCGGTGKLLDDTRCGICSGSGRGTEEKVGLRVTVYDLQAKVREMEHIVVQCDKFIQWGNEASDALREMRSAYERRIRSDCHTAEQLALKPWECTEYLGATKALNDKPNWFIDVPLPKEPTP